MDILRIRRRDIKPDDIVHVCISSRSETSVEVDILDYPGTKGFIDLNQLVKKLKSKKEIKIGNTFPAVVLSNDGVVTLSKRQVSDEDISDIEEEFKTLNSLKVLGYSIYILMKKFNEKYNIERDFTPEQVLENSVWRLIDDVILKDDGIKKINSDLYNHVLFNQNLLFNSFFDDSFKSWCSSVLQEKTDMTDIIGGYEFSLKSYLGINKVKDLLLKHSSDDITIRFIIPGTYLISCGGKTEENIKNKLLLRLKDIQKECNDNKILYLLGDYCVIKRSTAHFHPISEDSNIEKFMI